MYFKLNIKRVISIFILFSIFGTISLCADDVIDLSKKYYFMNMNKKYLNPIPGVLLEATLPGAGFLYAKSFIGSIFSFSLRTGIGGLLFFFTVKYRYVNSIYIAARKAENYYTSMSEFSTIDSEGNLVQALPDVYKYYDPITKNYYTLFSLKRRRDGFLFGISACIVSYSLISVIMSFTVFRFIKRSNMRFIPIININRTSFTGGYIFYWG